MIVIQGRAWKHSQYFLRQPLFLQWHPLVCRTCRNGDITTCAAAAAIAAAAAAPAAPTAAAATAAAAADAIAAAATAAAAAAAAAAISPSCIGTPGRAAPPGTVRPGAQRRRRHIAPVWLDMQALQALL